MKHRIIPQFEMPFVPNTFNLIRDTTLDGERITKERQQQEDSQREQERQQKEMLLPSN